MAPAGEDLNWRVIGRIYDQLDDLLLPYRFSLIKYDDHTDPEVAAHISRVGIPLYVRDQAAACHSPESSGKMPLPH